MVSQVSSRSVLIPSEVVQEHFPFEALYALRTVNSFYRDNFQKVLDLASAKLAIRHETKTYLELWVDDLPLAQQYLVASKLMLGVQNLTELKFKDRYVQLGLKLGTLIFIWPTIISLLDTQRFPREEVWIFFRQVYFELKPTSLGPLLLKALTSERNLKALAPRTIHTVLTKRLDAPNFVILRWLLQPPTVISDAELATQIANTPTQFWAREQLLSDVPLSLLQLYYLTGYFNLPISFFALPRTSRIQMYLPGAKDLKRLVSKQWTQPDQVEKLFEDGFLDIEPKTKYLIQHNRLGNLLMLDNTDINQVLTVLIEVYPSGPALRQSIYTVLRRNMESITPPDFTWPLLLSDWLPEDWQRLLVEQPGLFGVDYKVAWSPAVVTDLKSFHPMLFLQPGAQQAYTQQDLLQIIPNIPLFSEWGILDTWLGDLIDLVATKPELMRLPLTIWPLTAEVTTATTIGLDFGNTYVCFFWARDISPLRRHNSVSFNWLVACYRAQIYVDGLDPHPFFLLKNSLIWVLREFDPPTFVAYVRKVVGVWPMFEEMLLMCNIIEALAVEVDPPDFPHVPNIPFEENNEVWEGEDNNGEWIEED